jgi:hypothetical protein
MCPACGGFKRGGKTLCSGCYWRLPVVVQEGLKVDFGCGYGSAVEKALSMLKAGDGYWPRKR